MSKNDQKLIKKSEFLMAKLKNHSKSTKNSEKSWKSDKNSDPNFTLRIEHHQVLAMGVGNR